VTRSGWLVMVPVVALVGGACDQAGSAVPVPDAGGSSSTVDPSVLERGEYLVRTVAGCGECHTPRTPAGDLDTSQWLAGVANRFDLTPEDDTTGGISTANLTPYNLASWSDSQIEQAFVDGIAPDGSALYPLMPYYAYHNMTAADAAAIVTYLRAVPSIDNVVPPRQPLPVALLGPAPPLPETAIPQTTLSATDARYASAERGRYLAGEIGFCLDCHTPWRLGETSPLDLTLVFAGNRAFSAREWVVPAPAPAVVYSYDITPDATGIAGWTAKDMANLLVYGTEPDGSALCRPMPFGPVGSLGGLLAQDALDIGNYLTTIPPIDGGDIPQCPITGDM
jgi:mono/diheme cytochrome c family protein